MLQDMVGTSTASRIAGVSQSYITYLIRTDRLESIPTEIGHLIPRDAVEQLAKDRAGKTPRGRRAAVG